MEDEINLLEETREDIYASGHTIRDIMFVGSRNGKLRLSWKEFKKIANFKYDNGYGSQHIATDLIVYFKDKTYLDRHEYDGSERWQFNDIFNYSSTDEYQTYNCVGGSHIMWETLENINKY